MFDQVVSCPLLCLASDLTNHDDTLGVGVVNEELQTVDEVGSVEGVAADADTQRLAEAHGAGLVHGLVGEGARSRDHAHAPSLGMVSVVININGYYYILLYCVWCILSVQYQCHVQCSPGGCGRA